MADIPEQSKAQIGPQSHSETSLQGPHHTTIQTPLSPNASAFNIAARFLALLQQLQQGQAAILQDVRGLRQDVNGLRDEISRNATAPSEKANTREGADCNNMTIEPFYGENGQFASRPPQDPEVIKKLQGTCLSL